MQKQTAITAYLRSKQLLDGKQLLLFAFAGSIPTVQFQDKQE